jgi:multidrug efflux pump subunit AcrB
MNSLYNRLLEHKLAANLMMLLVLMAGLWGMSKLQSQLFPDIEIPVIRATITWSDADAQAVRSGIGKSLDAQLVSQNNQDDLYRSIRSTSRDGSLEIFLRLNDGINAKTGEEALQEAIDSISLPSGAEVSSLEAIQINEPVASLLIYGKNSGKESAGANEEGIQLTELRAIAFAAKDSLLATGLAQVDLSGVPERERIIEIDLASLSNYGLTLDQLASTINSHFSDNPAGNLDIGDQQTQLIVDSPEWSMAELKAIPINDYVRLGQVANISEQNTDSNKIYTYQGQSAVKIDIARQSGEDSLENAELLKNWLTTFEAQLPDGVEIQLFNEVYKVVEAQLQLVIFNGLSGMLLVIVVLFIFLRARLAIWVAAGIPIAFFGTLAYMGVSETSLNTISLFGFIIAIGIIVDDAIVVAEDAASLESEGHSPRNAAITAAKRMWPAVLASSLTTVAAFLPLLLIGGQFGSFLVDVPTVVTAAIVASLVECFLILPGHLGHTRKQAKQPNKYRIWMDTQFNNFRDGPFRKLVIWSLNHGFALIAFVVGCAILTIALVTSGRVEFVAAPSLDKPAMSISMQVTSGTSLNQAKQALDELQAVVEGIASEVEGDLIQTLYQEIDDANAPNKINLQIVLTSDTDRALSNAELLEQTQAKYTLPAYILNYSARRSFRGPGGGGDLEIRLEGEDINELKAASTYLQSQLQSVNELEDITDNLPNGSGQYRLELKDSAKASGLDLAAISRQLNTLLNGVALTQIETGFESIGVRLQLPDAQTQSETWLAMLPINLANGERLPLGALVSFNYQRGLDRIVSRDGKLSVTVSASYSGEQLEAIYDELEQGMLSSLGAQFAVSWEFEGQRKELETFIDDLKFVALIVFALIFIILAWVFESWAWPIAIIITVPFGLIGAALGHWIMGMPISSISAFGVVGLIGIIINDSIVLVTVFRRLHHAGMELKEAIVEAVCSRLRPVILTSITTMAGLMPLLFETSIDAVLLQPIAVGLVFGLGFGTILILLMVPVLLYGMERLKLLFVQSVK